MGFHWLDQVVLQLDLIRVLTVAPEHAHLGAAELVRCPGGQ